MITNFEIIMFYLALIMIVYSIPKIIRAVSEAKRWKEAYDERERITKHIMEYQELIHE